MKKIMMMLVLVLSFMMIASSVMAYTFMGSFVKNGGDYVWSPSSSDFDGFYLNNGDSILGNSDCGDFNQYLKTESLGYKNGMTVGYSFIPMPSQYTGNSGDSNYVWFTLDSNMIPDYYVVKGGSCDIGNNVLQLYGVDPNNPNDTTSFYDFFNTCGGVCDFSHISFYKQQCSAVPIPPSVLLLFSGMIGFIGIRRRKLVKS